jgi:hypothetical protein
MPLTAQTAVTYSRSQLRRTVDPSPRSAYGSVLMQKKGTQQIFQATVQQLGIESFALYVGDRPTFSTGCCVYAVAPLDRTNAKKGNWTRQLVGVGEAPPQLLVPDLSNLANWEVDVSMPGQNNLIIGVTNVVGNVTNVIYGIPVPTPDVTNLVTSSLWAPLYPLSANPSALSYQRKNAQTPPGAVPPPSPGATAKIAVKFLGSQGRSVFDVQAKKLTRGQVYHVFIADSTNQVSYLLIDAGTMTASKTGSSARFLRDTHFGDPLPQQVRDAGDLSGRVIQIRDDFGFIHLSGVIP